MAISRRLRRVGELLCVTLPLVGWSEPGIAAQTEVCVGTRWVAQDGSDQANDCTVAALPCATISHAVAAAAPGETICVGDLPNLEVPYEQDVLIDKPVHVQGDIDCVHTWLRGHVRLVASGASLHGIGVQGGPGAPRPGACIAIGDSDHPGVRNVEISKARVQGCEIGVQVTDTGSVPGLNVIRDLQLSNTVLTANPDSGTGILLGGVNDGLEIRGGSIADNPRRGLLFRAPTGTPQAISILGSQVLRNAGAGIEVRGDSAINLRVEGSEIGGHAAGTGIVVDGAHVSMLCNFIHDNATGVALRNGATGSLGSQRVVGQTSVGLSIDPTSSVTGTIMSVFAGNAVAVDNGNPLVPVNARQCWWNTPDGPSGEGLAGTGDAVHGLVDTGDFVARTTTPLLARRPAVIGDWDAAPGACYPLLEGAIHAATAGDLVLAGAGTYPEILVVDKAVDLEGEATLGGCPLTVLDGARPAGQQARVLWYRDVDSVTVRTLTIRNAGGNVPCGTHGNVEVGLNLLNVTNSRFSDLCLSANGTTEVRLFGATTDNVLRRLTIDGTLPDSTGECPHRSREAVLIDGGPLCEGGPGGSADRNTITDSTITNVAHGIAVRYATGTSLVSDTISPAPSAQWFGGGDAVGVVIGPADATDVSGLTIDSASLQHGVRVAGLRKYDCAADRLDSTGTTIAGGAVRNASGAGIHLARNSGDPGAPVGTLIRCVDLARNGYGVLADSAGVPGASNTATFVAIHGNATAGIENSAPDVFPARANWWGDPSGPAGLDGGRGDLVIGPVDATGFLAGSPLVDNDGDGFTVCTGDCNDTLPDVYPGAPEPPDGIDHNCDGTVTGGTAPGPTDGLTATSEAGGVLLSWPVVARATGYDVVMGDVGVLLSTGGDFGQAVSQCAAPNVQVYLLRRDDPVQPGGALWYLVRARNAAGAGTYDVAGGLARPRDAEISLAPAACP